MPKKKVKIKQKARIKKRNEQKDTLKRMEVRPPADVAPTFRFKVKRK